MQLTISHWEQMYVWVREFLLLHTCTFTSQIDDTEGENASAYYKSLLVDLNVKSKCFLMYTKLWGTSMKEPKGALALVIRGVHFRDQLHVQTLTYTECYGSRERHFPTSCADSPDARCAFFPTCISQRSFMLTFFFTTRVHTQHSFSPTCVFAITTCVFRRAFPYQHAFPDVQIF